MLLHRLSLNGVRKYRRYKDATQYQNSEMKLFDDIERTFLGSSKHNEKTYDYYQRSARIDIGIVRDKLNHWFDDYPENEKKEFKSGFKDKFDDSFYELFIFQLFKSLEFSITVHPKLPNSPKRPDFLVKKGELEFYVEAKIVKNKSATEEALDRKIGEFYDGFSKIKLSNFLLNVDSFVIKTQKQPNTKAAVKYIESEVKKLDPEKITQDLTTLGFDGIPIITFENEDLRVVVKPMPTVVPIETDELVRPIGMYPSESFWGGSGNSIKDSIDLKAKRYGELDKPFIICLNLIDYKVSGQFDVQKAVWGDLAWSWSEDPNNRDEKWVRSRNGAFLGEKGPRLKNLSGIFLSKVFPHTLPSAKYWLFEHPFSENIFDFNQLGLIYSYVKEGKIIENTGENLDTILGISRNWLIANDTPIS
ncbi:hypothetical protein WG906_04805 [Pedobacter sp. P351]|uniref:hypothetical protein n=1 Tax=Pedobacter superstes TaxID=3133441 RepID=UPI0030AD4169